MASFVTDISSISSNSPPSDVRTKAGDYQYQSWLFRLGSFFAGGIDWLFGSMALLILLAILSNIPVLNLLVLGYLLETSRRVAVGEPVARWLVGCRKVSVLGGVLASGWVLLLPIRYLSLIAYEAALVDPGSPEAASFRLLKYIVAVLLSAHFLAALSCGAKLRYFFWPLIIPISFTSWGFRKLLSMPFLFHPLRMTTEWFCPGLVEDVVRVRPWSDWFLPLILWNKLKQADWIRHTFQQLSIGLSQLHFYHFFRLGLGGFVGTFAWIFIPTSLLISATVLEEPALAMLAAILGWITAVPIFAILPLLQTHFSVTMKFRSFFEMGHVVSIFARSPVWYLCAWTLAVVFALPLFLLKVESIPTELLWILSIVFLIFIWPTRLAFGWSYRRALKRERPCSIWIVLPMAILTLPVSTAFVSILALTRYTSWRGVVSLYENHLVLLPAPFWF